MTDIAPRPVMTAKPDLTLPSVEFEGRRLTEWAGVVKNIWAEAHSPADALALADHYLAAAVLAESAVPDEATLPRWADSDCPALQWAHRVGAPIGSIAASLSGSPPDRQFLNSPELYISTGLAATSVLVSLELDSGQLAVVVVPAEALTLTIDNRGRGLFRFQDYLLDGSELLMPLDDAAGEMAALLHAAVVTGFADHLYEYARSYVRAVGQPWAAGAYGRLIDDPSTVQGFGKLRAQTTAASRLVRLAAELRDGTAPSPNPAGQLAAGEAARISAAASALVLNTMADTIFDVLGAGGIDDTHVWALVLQARQLTERESLAWRYSSIGQEQLAGTTISSDAEVGISADEGVHRITDESEIVPIARSLAHEVARDAIVRDQQRQLPRHQLELLRRSGLLGITVPRQFGGVEASARSVAEVVRILSEVDASFAQHLQPHFGTVGTIRLAGDTAQRTAFFNRVLEGDRIGSAVAEIGTKHSGDITTRLIATASGGFRVMGRKFYTTGAITADWVAVTARDPAGNVAVVLLPVDAPGVEILDDWDGVGQRTTASGTATFDNVRVPASNIINQATVSLGAHITLVPSNVIHSALNTGIGRGALRAAHQFITRSARPQKSSGVETVLEDPHLVRRFGELATKLVLAEALLLEAAEHVDASNATQIRGEISDAYLALDAAEAFAGDVSLEISGELFALGGSSSTRGSHGLDRYWRDVRTHSLRDSARWKYHRVGDAQLTGALYPTGFRAIL
jgi:SfnB family sulfur acquisition oxidoreductase